MPIWAVPFNTELGRRCGQAVAKRRTDVIAYLVALGVGFSPVGPGAGIDRVQYYTDYGSDDYGDYQAPAPYYPNPYTYSTPDNYYQPSPYNYYQPSPYYNTPSAPSGPTYFAGRPSYPTVSPSYPSYPTAGAAPQPSVGYPCAHAMWANRPGPLQKHARNQVPPFAGASPQCQ